MRRQAPLRPWSPGVERSFDANRLATTFQVQAYVGVLPEGVFRDGSATTPPENVSVEASVQAFQGGVAA